MAAAGGAEQVARQAAADGVGDIDDLVEGQDGILTGHGPLGIDDRHGGHKEDAGHAGHILAAGNGVAGPADGGLQGHRCGGFDLFVGAAQHFGDGSGCHGGTDAALAGTADDLAGGAGAGIADGADACRDKEAAQGDFGIKAQFLFDGRQDAIEEAAAGAHGAGDIEDAGDGGADRP